MDDRSYWSKLLNWRISRRRAFAASGATAAGAATGFTMAWPCIGIFGVYQGSGSYYYGHRLWVDETKPPFKSS
jgi:hypothetical protein